MIIDDEAVIRDGCVRILQKEGWKVETADKGHEGIELLKNRNFDILLLDLMMPGMSGLEVLSEVKELSIEIYIIVITGYATIETAVEAMKKGAFDYISKPFTPDQLRVVVRKVLQNKALRMEAEFLRKEQEKGLLAIAREKSKIRTIMDCIPNGVLVIDSDKRVALNNPMASKLLNVNSMESIGLKVEECIDCPDLINTINEVLENALDDDPYRTLEIEQKGLAPQMAHIAPVTMEDGSVIGAVVILQDISAQKLIDKMKSDFMAKVTHELKTPAATINQLLMTIQSGVVGKLEDEQEKMVGRARLWGDTMLELISDLLNISKIESGLAIVKFEPMEIDEVIDYVIEMIKPQAEKKNIRIVSNLNGNHPMIYADRGSMKDVFVNLVSNAVKYSENDTEIKIKGEADKDFLNISVTDSGFGISGEDIPHLFERFFRVKTDKTRRIMGTGLGLPIVKEIIDSHHGLIKIESVLDQGSTFTVSLPLHNA